MHNKYILKLTVAILLLSVFTPSVKVKCSESIHHQEWIDHNKNNKLEAYEKHNLPIEERIRDLISRMTLEEKIGQLLQYPETYLREGEEFSSDNARQLI